ncbi:hypothetical protein QA597_11415 [Marinilabiliaceae bacterium ANBcel2]|nr:hypothetical protein [Marinilabiliaceae bacterium ANBcel2]
MKNIRLGKGLEKLKFGMTREEVKSIFGEPDETEVFVVHEDDTDRSEAWHYDTIELSATFDEEDQWRLTSMAISSPEYLFEDVNLIGQSQEQVLQQVDLLNLGEVDIEQLSDESDENQLVATIPDVNLNLWFENGILSEIQWGPFWDDEKEEYVWPD